MSKFQPAKSDPLLISALQWIEKDSAAQRMDHRVDVTLKRGAAELDLLSQSLPGLEFADLSFSEDLDGDPGDELVYVRVIGAGADLVRHGFMSARQLQAVAKCKGRKVLRHDDGSCIEVDRRAAGFRVRRRVPLDTIARILAAQVWSPNARSIR